MPPLGSAHRVLFKKYYNVFGPVDRRSSVERNIIKNNSNNKKYNVTQVNC